MAVIQGEQRYQLITLKLDSGDSIETTAEHPFYIKGKGWNPANSLKVGEALQLHNGTTVVIKQIETGIRVEKVYNLTVANTHNYFVGEDGVLVHNCPDKRKDAGKNDQHGKAEDMPSDLKRLAELEEKLKTATGREKTKIKAKIENIKKAMAKRRKGTQDSQNPKGKGS